jgi:hypothetical protein
MARMSKKLRGFTRPDHYRLHFQGGPLDGKVKEWPFVPRPKFGCRRGDEQFWYEAQEVDENTGKVKMVLANHLK